MPHLLHEALVGGRPAGWGRKLVAQRQQPQLQGSAGQGATREVRVLVATAEGTTQWQSI
jgi:hypothetical protein